jgi:hypothetical protein
MNPEQGWVNTSLQQCNKIFHNQARVHNEGSAYLEMNREREDAVILRDFSLVWRPARGQAPPNCDPLRARCCKLSMTL